MGTIVITNDSVKDNANREIRLPDSQTRAGKASIREAFWTNCY